MNDAVQPVQDEQTAIDKNDQYLWGERCDVLRRTVISYEYHRLRQEWFSKLDFFYKILSLVASSAVLGQLLFKQTWASEWIAGIAAFASIVNFVRSFREAARLEESLAERFKVIEGEILGQGPRDFEESHINSWRQKLSEIEKNEPPVMNGVVLFCQYKYARSQGSDEDLEAAGWWHQLWMHWWNCAPPKGKPPVEQK